MPTATVTVEYVNQPKPGRKQGSIKTTNGQYIGVWPEKLSQFRNGGTYEIEYETQIGREGKEWHTLKRVIGGDQMQSVGQASRRVTGTIGARGGMDNSEHIFVTGLMGRALQGTGMLPDEDTLADWVLRLRGAWQRGFAAAVAPQQRPLTEELNDEIPF